MDHPSTLRGLYAITPEGRPLPQLLRDVEAVLDGGASLLQFRDKSPSSAQREAVAAAIQSLCQQYRVPMIINDDAAFAARIGAAGVHLGRGDGDIDAARARLGPHALIGVSCYGDIARAEAAVAAGADYVAFGSMFASTSKPLAPRAPLMLLTDAANRLPVPVCAIGGITLANAQDVLAAGATVLAVIGDLFDAVDPGAAAAGYRRLFDTGSS